MARKQCPWPAMHRLDAAYRLGGQILREIFGYSVEPTTMHGSRTLAHSFRICSMTYGSSNLRLKPGSGLVARKDLVQQLHRERAPELRLGLDLSQMRGCSAGSE